MGHRIFACDKFKSLEVEARRKWIVEKRRCFRCLGFGHRAQECKSARGCNVDGCEEGHHQLLHIHTRERKKSEKESDTSQENVIAHAYKEAQGSRIMYQVLPVTLIGPNGAIKTYAFLDVGSAFTIMDKDIANKLGLKQMKKPFSFGGLGYQGERNDSTQVEVTIMSHYTGKEFKMKDVQTDTVNYLPRQSCQLKDFKKWKHLDGIPIETYVDASPKILIGLPHADLVVPTKRSDGHGNQPIGCLTKLGWVISGKVPSTIESPKRGNCFILRETGDEDLHELVKSQYSIENFGVKVTTEKVRSKEDKRAEQLMESTAKRVGDQFEIGLLWKHDDITLPESWSNAIKRLHTVERRMDREPEFAKIYCDKLKEYEDKGFIRKLTQDEVLEAGPRKWYLPHFGVTNPNKPGKFRLVFDGAAQSHGTSLNDHLLKGPDYVPPLPAVLYRFRQRVIGYTADITDMFHRVKMRKEDQCAQQFLWRGMARDRSPDTYALTVMFFGSASSPSCAQYVKNRNATEVGKDHPEAVNDIIKNHYVDDYPGSCDTVDESKKRFQDVFNIHKKGGFHICKWISNSREFNESIPEELRATGMKSLENGDKTERVLGLHWDPAEDIFTFKTSFPKTNEEILKAERMPTKREALPLVMSVFDPLGFLSVFTVKSKIILQETWRSGVGWDDTIPKTSYEKWTMWIQELHQLSRFQIPRCYSRFFTNPDSQVHLHIFVDASESAFSAVAYFRITNGSQVDVTLVTSKAKVAPLKPISIPRMELQAAVMGCRLAQSIKEDYEVKIHGTTYWSDSRTVLCWLRADGRKFQQFVAHRIGEIQQVSETTEWRWIPTNENVADEATRDNKPCDFGPASRWVNGPSFLKLPVSEWPVEKTPQQYETVSDDLELKKEFLGFVNKSDEWECPIPIKNFSSWTKLIIATSMTLLGIKKWQRKPNIDVTRGAYQIQNLRLAKQQWCKWAQRQDYYEEISCIKAGQKMKPGSALSKLSAFLDKNDILRMEGRIPQNAKVFGLDRNPIILNAKNPYTVLLIKNYHNEAGHHGLERIINDIRQNYCIPNIRAAVKKSFSDCLICQKRRASPAQPRMGQLPPARLKSFVHPFTKTGLDYFGPMDVTKGRKHEKRYGALFTCMSTRAVHLEIAESLSTDSFLNALRRFIARRGCPEDIYSDNGKNFVGAENELKRALEKLNQQQIESTLALKGIKWPFIPPASPHMGGSWERLVKAVKVALNATLKTRAPKEEVLQTLMVEAEHTVNSRPLTHVSCDPEDPEALTPNHFLIGRSSNVPVWRASEGKENVCLRQNWEMAQHLSDQFWKRWVREYMPDLLKRSKWLQEENPIKVGDVVIVVDNNLPRNMWPLGRIIATYPGLDGQVRTVDVKTVHGTYKRPAVKICVLDVTRSTETDDPDEDNHHRGIVSGPEGQEVIAEQCLETST